MELFISVITIGLIVNSFVQPQFVVVPDFQNGTNFHVRLEGEQGGMDNFTEETYNLALIVVFAMVYGFIALFTLLTAYHLPRHPEVFAMSRWLQVALLLK